MRCARARRRILDHELRRVPADGELRAHLERCPQCARESRAGSRVAADLGRLRTEAPFHVDVAARVLTEIGWSSRPPSRSEVPRLTLAWIAAWAVATAACLVGILAPRLPAILGDVTRTGAFALSLAKVVVYASRPAFDFLQAAAVVAYRGWAALDSGVSLLVRSVPSLETSSVATILALAAVTAGAVARDVRSRRNAPPSEEI